ncbi:hypothetical protein IM40_00885 [Candidatus Paracaedimonas acanthamoebae]|nr:hypothetical protein IM40_00885 [Candidatus Paracaedimonas acanthamoebae]
MKKGLLLAYSSFSLFYASFANAASPSLPSVVSPEMRKKAEEAIASCERSYQNVKEQGKRLDNIKKPRLIDSQKAKKAYKNKEVYKKVFNLRFAQFAEFTNDKTKIRTAKEVSKFQEEINAYSSNCARFAGGLVEFVEWAVTGKPKEKGYERIFKRWIEEAN